MSVSATLGQFLTRAFTKWDLAQIPYVVLRNYEQLPERTPGDVDILVQADRLEEAEVLLTAAAVETGWRLHHRAEFSPVSLFFSTVAGDAQVHIDLFKHLVWRGAEILPAQAVLAQRRQYKNFHVPDPVHEAILNLLTRLLYAGYIKEKYRPAILDLARRDPAALQGGLMLVFNPDTALWVADRVRAGAWSEIERRVQQLRRELVINSIRRHPITFLCRLVRDAVRLTRRLLHPPGILLVLIGPDGSGKSTVADRIVQELNVTFPADKALRRHWKPCFLPRRSRQTDERWVRNPHGRPPRGKWKSSAIFLYHCLDFVLGHYFKYLPVRFRNGLVLVERHYYDFFVDQRRYLLQVPTWLVRFTHRFLPPADLVVLLHASPEVLLARKREIAPEEVKRQCSAFVNLVQTLPQGVIIDCAPPLDVVVRDLRATVLDFLALRTRRRWPETGRLESISTLDWLGSIMCRQGIHAAIEPGQRPKRRIASDKDQTTTQYYFAVPSLASPRLLVPAHSRKTAVAALALYNPRRARAKAFKQALYVGLGLGLTSPLGLHSVRIRCADVAGDGGTDATLTGYLQRVLGRPDLVTGVFAGTEGAHRKPVAAVIDRNGNLLGFAKVGWNEPTNACVAHEAEVLSKLRMVRFSAGVLPALIHTGRWYDRAVTVVAPPPGQLRTAPNTPGQAHLQFLLELIRTQPRRMELTRSPFWPELRLRISQLELCGPSYWYGLLTACLDKAAAMLAEKELVFGWTHRDFVPWNTYIAEARLYVFDWEYATETGLAGWDLFHFLTQTMALVHRHTAREIHERIFYHRATWALVYDYFRNTCPELGVDQIRAIYALYLADVASWYLVRDAHLIDFNGYALRHVWRSLLTRFLTT